MPINPPGQVQLKLFMLSTHVPLLKHGLLAHSLISATKVTVTERMHVLLRFFAGNIFNLQGNKLTSLIL